MNPVRTDPRFQDEHRNLFNDFMESFDNLHYLVTAMHVGEGESSIETIYRARGLENLFC